MSWVVGRIDAVAPTAIEHETRVRVGYAVTVALVAVLCAVIFGGLGLVVGSVYRGLANLGLVVSAGLLLYVAWISHLTYRRSERPASTLAVAVGVIGLSALGLASLLLTIILLTGFRPPTDPLEALRAIGILTTGLWFVGLSALEYGIHVISSWVATFGFAAGIGATMLGAGLLFTNGLHPVVLLGTAVFVTGFVPWAVVLRSHLLASYE